MNADNEAYPDSLDAAELERIGQICDRFEAAWRTGNRPRIEDYLSSIPEQVRSVLLRGLVDLELDYRHKQGETPTQQEYESRFPDWAEVLRLAFAKQRQSIDRSQASTHERVDASLAETQDAVLGAGPRKPGPSATPKSIGRYKIVGVLGRGAFGMVYRAHDEELDRDVAIKVWRADRFPSDEDAESLLNEARAVARLDKHPSIVGVHDVGRQEDGSCYIVLEFVEGQSLSQELKARRLPADRIWEIMFQVTSAIQHAHAAGLVHRDLKPANILLDDAGNAHVADFGLAVDETSQRYKAGEISGTPAYMAPEQVRGEAHRLDGRADIWAVGIILYEMLTGRRPFHGDNHEELFDEIMHREPKPPRQIDPNIDEGLQEVCLKCLAKSVTERYPTAADLANDLREAHPEQEKRNGRPIALVAVAVALLAVIAAWQIVVRITHRDIVIRTPEGDTVTVGRDGTVDVTMAERPPISRMALVSNPASIPGVQSWTIETRGHRGEVLSVAHSPDGRLLATGCEDGTIRLWNPATGEFVKALIGHDGAVQAVSWAPDSKQLASGSSDNTVRTWDVPSGQQTEELPVENPDNRPVFVEFSPDGTMLAFGGGDGQIHLWNITERKPMPPLAGPPEGIRSVAWSSDSKMLAAAGGDNNVTLWKVADATVVRTFRGHTAPVTDTAFSPDDKYVASSSSAASGEQQARVWETASGKPHCVLPGHLKGAQCVAFSTDGRLLVTGGADGDGRVRVWNIETSALVYELESKDGGNRIAGVAISPDGTLLAIAHHDGTVQLCELESGEPLRELPKASEESVRVSPEGQLADSESTRDEVIYIVHTDGTQTTLAPSQFEERYGSEIAWKQEASRARMDAPPPAIAPFDAEQAKKHQQAWADYLSVPVETENSIGMKFVLIPPGEFDMGSTEDEVERLLEEAKANNASYWYIDGLPSEAPKHRVRITKPYWLSRHEVTWGQFRRFVDDCGYKTEAERDGKGGIGYVSGQLSQAPRFVWNADLSVEQADEYPVVQVSWNDAMAFCEWLSEKEGVTCHLPSEAQWEYACRAGTTTYWHCGDSETTLQEYAWFDVNSGASTHPVGQLRPNAWGLYDMHGNVWELCSDWYGQDYYGASPENDPTGSADGTLRVFRGGGWCDGARGCRSAYRDWGVPSYRSGGLGFRVARSSSGQ